MENEAAKQPVPEVVQDHAVPIQSKIISKTVNVVEPFSNKLVSVPADQLQDALDDDYRLATPADVHHYKKDQEFGTATQQAITAAEAAAGSMSFGTSYGAETALGLTTPERIRAREEVNPGMHTIGDIAGLATPMGEAKILGIAGKGIAAKLGGKVASAEIAAQAASKAKNLGAEESAKFIGSAIQKAKKEAGFLNRIGEAGIKGAVEMGLYQAGEEVAKQFKEDPAQSAATAASNLGLSTLFGGIGGGVLGGAAHGIEKALPKSFVSEVEAPALEAGEFNAGVKHADNLTPDQKSSIFGALRERKPNADKIEQSSRALGITPLEGMTLNHKSVQMAEDALINGPPTIHSLARKQLYNDAFQKAENATSDALGAKSNYTKAELGNILKDNLTKKINEQAAPVEALYNGIKGLHETIPLAENAAKEVSSGLGSMKEFKIAPSSPEGKMVGRVIGEIENLQTVDDVKTYRAILNRSISPMAPAGEKRIAAIISDKLSDLEEKSIIDAARKSATSPEQKLLIENSIKTMAEAKKAYKPFIEKLSQLADGLGKSRVYGKQDALNFINDHLTAENVIQKLSTKGDSAFRQFLTKEFPNEASTVALYQKSLLRDAASKDGVLNVNKVLKDIGKLPKEIQEQIFSKEEIEKLSHVKTVMESMPKTFNPSGTAHTMEFRKHFEDPRNVAIGNLKDAAITKFIKEVGDNDKKSFVNRVIDAVVKGEASIKKGTRAIFKKGAEFPIILAPIVAPNKREKVKKHLDEYTLNPEKLLDLHSNPAIPPEFAQEFGSISAGALSYLNSIKPNTDKMGPLDPKRVPSKAEEEKYNRAIDLAEHPLSILGRIKDGTIVPEDVKCINAIYPKLYEKLTRHLVEEMNAHISKDDTIPYRTKISLSMFMAHPLDSTMQPMAIQAAQPKPPQPQGQAPKSMNALNKMPGMYQTPDQARAANKMKA